jgi:hypothetical protein
MPAMTDAAGVDEALDRLRRAGWSVGDAVLASGWMVLGTYGENQIRALGATRTAVLT